MSRQQYLIYYFALGDGFAAAAAAAWGLWDNFNWQIPNYKLCKIWAKGGLVVLIRGRTTSDALTILLMHNLM